MTGIDLLIDEHKHILQVISVLYEKNIQFLETTEIDIPFYKGLILFARNYADIYHHQKEEAILFRYLEEELGKLAETLVRHGMMVEHDLARLYILELENALMAYETESTPRNALEVLSYSMSYGHLLERHIYKEDQVLFPFAEKKLSEAGLKAVNESILAMVDPKIFTTYTDFLSCK